VAIRSIMIRLAATLRITYATTVRGKLFATKYCFLQVLLSSTFCVSLEMQTIASNSMLQNQIFILGGKIFFPL